MKKYILCLCIIAMSSMASADLKVYCDRNPRMGNEYSQLFFHMRPGLTTDVSDWGMQAWGRVFDIQKENISIEAGVDPATNQVNQYTVVYPGAGALHYEQLRYVFSSLDSCSATGTAQATVFVKKVGQHEQPDTELSCACEIN